MLVILKRWNSWVPRDWSATVGLDRAKQVSAFPNESFRFDDTVVVLGAGPLGVCFVMKARMLGAGTIVAVDLSEYRLDFATGAYFKSFEAVAFYPEISVVFSVAEGERHVHVPLLLSPFGYSTYRGK